MLSEAAMRPMLSDRLRLEKIYRNSPSRTLIFQFQRFFYAIGQAFMGLTTGDRCLPHLSKLFDTTGAAVWRAYDPVSRQSFTSNSEIEILAWLEKCYFKQVDTQ